MNPILEFLLWIVITFILAILLFFSVLAAIPGGHSP